MDADADDLRSGSSVSRLIYFKRNGKMAAETDSPSKISLGFSLKYWVNLFVNAPAYCTFTILIVTFDVFGIMTRQYRCPRKLYTVFQKKYLKI